MAGGLTSVLTILEGGLPGISTARYEQLRAEAAEEPLIDAVASSILFPTIIRNVSTGQGEPLGIVFAVDADYDQQFGLTNIDGEPVQMESLQPGVGNIFQQASNLFALAQSTGANLLGDNFSISDAALTTAAVGAALTAGAASGAADQGLDLADISIPITTVRSLGIDTTLLEQQGITQSLSLSALGITTSTLAAIGVNTTTVGLDDIGIDTSAVQTVTNNLLGALNLNTLGTELDRVLAQFGLQLRQGDVYLSALGAERLDARVGDVLEIYVGPIPIPFRVKGIVAEAGPLGAVLPVVMMRLDEAQQLFFMSDKVNNVLVSNLGDDLGGMVHTQAVSQRLKVLALDPHAVQRVVEILRRPAVRKVVDTQAAQIQEQIEEDIDAPPIIAALVQSFAGLEEYAQSIRSLPAALDQPGTSDELRTLLANTEVRNWLTEQRLSVADATELESALSALNQFDVPDPLNKATVVQVANVGGTVFSSIFSLFGIFSILAGVMLIFLIFVMLAAERRSEMGMATRDRRAAQPPGADVCHRRRALRSSGGGVGGGTRPGHLLLDGRLYRRHLQRCEQPTGRIQCDLPFLLPRAAVVDHHRLLSGRAAHLYCCHGGLVPGQPAQYCQRHPWLARNSECENPLHPEQDLALAARSTVGGGRRLSLLCDMGRRANQYPDGRQLDSGRCDDFGRALAGPDSAARRTSAAAGLYADRAGSVDHLGSAVGYHPGPLLFDPGPEQPALPGRLCPARADDHPRRDYDGDVQRRCAELVLQPLARRHWRADAGAQDGDCLSAECPFPHRHGDGHVCHDHLYRCDYGRRDRGDTEPDRAGCQGERRV